MDKASAKAGADEPEPKRAFVLCLARQLELALLAQVVEEEGMIHGYLLLGNGRCVLA